MMIEQLNQIKLVEEPSRNLKNHIKEANRLGTSVFITNQQISLSVVTNNNYSI